MGELSAGRQALEGAEVVPGTGHTLDRLRDPVRRPHEPREPLPYTVSSARPAKAFILDDLFLHNFRTSRRGAASAVVYFWPIPTLASSRIAILK